MKSTGFWIEWKDELDTADSAAWQSFFDESDAHPFQNPYSLELGPPPNRGEAKFMLVWRTSSKSSLAACVLIRERRYPFDICRWTVPRGPMCELANLESVLMEILKQAKKQKISSVTVAPYSSGSSALTAEDILKMNGFRLCSLQGGHNRSVEVNLFRSVEDILSEFSDNTRYQIRRSERTGLIVEDVQSSDDAMEFENLYNIMMVSRDREPSASGHFARFFEFLKKHPEGGLFLVTKMHGRIVAGIVLIRNRVRSWYIQGASDDSLRKLPLTFQCHWHAIQRLKAEGIRFYDMGGLGNENEHPEMVGINHFKRGFSSREIDCTREFEKIISPLRHALYMQGRRVQKFSSL